jgi:hypothetical protein
MPSRDRNEKASRLASDALAGGQAYFTEGGLTGVLLAFNASLKERNQS